MAGAWQQDPRTLEAGVMQRICAASGTMFEVTPQARAFYERLGVPLPTLCPVERARRRMAFRSVRHLYRRKCAGTHKEIICLYSADKDLQVFDDAYWWSDNWSARDYARDFDFNRPFFEQFAELTHAVPRMATNGSQNENSRYTSYAGWNKDCYLIFYSDHNRDCFYLSDSFHNHDSIDCAYLQRSELCSQCVSSENCYNGRFLLNCKNCSDCWFLSDCVGCKYCFGCVNLHNQEYHIYNEPYTRVEYFEKLALLNLSSSTGIAQQRVKFRDFRAGFPHKYLNGNQNEEVSGDYLVGCKDVIDSYHVEYSRECAYLIDCQKCVNCQDMDGWGGAGAELVYEGQTVGERAHSVMFSSHVWDGASDIAYSDACMQSHNLFGCAGLRHAEYCILNKQYSKDEYRLFRQKIIGHMQETGEWGEFFPINISPFCYNETRAYEWYPLSKEEVLGRGGKWYEPAAGDRPIATLKKVPVNLVDAQESICDELISCNDCGAAFKIQRAEFRLYLKQSLPLPDQCHNCRHKERIATLNPQKLNHVKCFRCAVELLSTFDAKHKVVCEQCWADLQR